MKKRTENQKLIRRLRTYFKESLFLPIFYTVIYGLVMIALIILPDYTLFQRITGGTLVFAILAIYWVGYGFGKRIEKNTKKDIDELEISLENAETSVDSVNEILEVEEQKGLSSLTEEQFAEFSKNYRVFSNYSIFAIIFNAVFSIFFTLRNVIAIPSWLRIVIYSLYSCVFIVSGYLTIKAYLKVRKYVKSDKKEEL